MPTAASSTNARSTWPTTWPPAGRPGNRCIFGVMVESHLQGGAQKFTPGKDDPTSSTYGKSITDACIGWAQTEGLLAALAAASQA
jgi:3-deoxy-7-phosphoheptulonate synthase